MFSKWNIYRNPVLCRQSTYDARYSLITVMEITKLSGASREDGRLYVCVYKHGFIYNYTRLCMHAATQEIKLGKVRNLGGDVFISLGNCLSIH